MYNTYLKRFLALLTAILLLLPLAGCLVLKEDQGTDNTHADDPKSDAVYDANAIAIELGDIRITAEEVADTFDQYIGYLGYGYEMNEETLEQFMRMTEEWLIEYHLPEWAAAKLGITLSAEQEEKCAAAAQADVDDERDWIILTYSDHDDSVTEVNQLTEEQRAAAIETVNGILAEQYGETYTFDDYLSVRYADCLTSYRNTEFSDLLKDWFDAENPVSKAEVDEWYDSALAEQEDLFTDTPEEFLYAMNTYFDFGEEIVLYAPADAAKLELIRLTGSSENQDAISENERQTEALEAEYGKLALSGEDAARRAEIETEYARLKEEHAVLTESSEEGLLKTAQEILAQLDGGMSFTDAMNAYNDNGGLADGTIVEFVFTDGSETKNKALAEAAMKLTVGAYSEPTPIDGDYYIIRLAESIPAGVIDRASIADELNKSAADSIRADAWNAQNDAWLQDAKNAAVYHRETYNMLIAMYLG